MGSKMLKFRVGIALPTHDGGGFDHADVYGQTGNVFVAHTANGTVEVIDGTNLSHLATIPGCPEASGVLCAQQEGIVFAAARATGKILKIDANDHRVVSATVVGTTPNGLAWDTRRGRLLVADVRDNNARLISMTSGTTSGILTLSLPGRPRWCAYSKHRDSFFVNIRDPATLVEISAGALNITRRIPISAPGPHGLGVDEESDRAFIACDGKVLVVVDLNSGREVASIPISGEPDVVWLNPKRKALYCSFSKPGVVDIIDTSKLVLTGQVKTEEGAHTSAFDNERQRFYALLPLSCKAAVYEEVD